MWHTNECARVDEVGYEVSIGIITGKVEGLKQQVLHSLPQQIQFQFG